MRQDERVDLARPASRDQFAADVQYYLALQPRQLPSRYFYDDLGSALFEAICHLPWYRVTRAEQRLLDRHAPDIYRSAGSVRRIVELGPGSGQKLATLVAGRQSADSLVIHLIDVSATALAAAAGALAGLDGIEVTVHEASYEDGLEAIAGVASSGRTLAVFLGSNIGNFDQPGAAAFLRRIRGSLARGDGFLMGTDLVKPERELLLAYDDPLGVTAAFNKNLLSRINQELGGDFDLGQFRHRAVWNRDESRVEMHLVSAAPQRIRIPAADLTLAMAEGETIWTESSYKYEPAEVRMHLADTGFDVVRQWIDEDDLFALTLARAV
jgi:L-histidine Nalpha-methyltransferase